MAVKKKKGKTSKIKKNNITKTKLYKQGKIKKKGHKASNVSIKSLQNQYQDEAETEDNNIDCDNMIQMIDKNDLEFLKSAVSNPSYSLFSEKRKNIGQKNDQIDQIEEKYNKKIDIDYKLQKPKLQDILPLKTSSGCLIRKKREVEWADEEENDELIKEPEIEDLNDEPLTTVKIWDNRDQNIAKYKLHIGVLSSSLLESPQTKVKNIALLVDTMTYCQSEIRFTVQKLVMLSLTEVFKDILPSYQIKHQENSVKLKKDTKVLHEFEKSLLKGYRLFLTRLEKHAKCLYKKRGSTCVRTEPMLKVGEMAVACVVELLERHPYFNYNINIVQMLTPYLNNPRQPVRLLVANGYSRIFKEDKRGEITLEIVRRINHLVKSKSHLVHKEVISVLMSLRIKDVNLDKEKEAEIKQKKFMTHKQKLLAMSKRERKRSKKLEELEKELLETKAEENKESKQKYLTEVMKVVFSIYFRILKKAPSSKVLSAVLAGLAKFAHCINIEFFADLISVLDDLMDGPLHCREKLHCVQTVFTILSGQGEALNIDPSRFYTHLYNNLLHIHSGRTHEDIKIVLEIMEILLIQRRKKITQKRLFAFTKRLSILATQHLHNGAVGALSLIRRILQMGMGADVLLDVDSTLGQGIYEPELEEPEHANAANTALWELTLLQTHYHPTVRQLVKDIVVEGEQHNPQVSSDITKLNSIQLYDHFDPSEIAFKPAVPAPAKEVTGIVKAKESSTYVKELLMKLDSLPERENVLDIYKEVYTLGSSTHKNTTL